MAAGSSAVKLAKRTWLPARYPVWGLRPTASPGYTLVIPVPGDLPVFTSIALTVCRLQDPTHRLETVVVPDGPSPAVAGLVSDAQGSWPGRLRLLQLPAIDRTVLPRLGDPGKNHGAQIVTAVRAARSSHVVLHDADLFMLSPSVHRAEYEFASAHGSAAVGIDRAWDRWFASHGRQLVATWEMCAAVNWLRATPPWRLFGHDARMFGEQHTFDTTFWGQCHTHPSRLVVRPQPGGVVHFNYVISTYRRLQRAKGQPVSDYEFRLLLIRLLIDLFDPDRAGYVVPERQDLVRGLDDSEALVTYATVEPRAYQVFRREVDGILTGDWLDPSRRAEAARFLDPFDDRFGV